MLFNLLFAVTVPVVAIAHRGLHGEGVAQNSVESFRAAYAAGAKWIETDFHQLDSGRILCVHDQYELKCISGVDHEIASLTAAEIAAIDIGKTARTASPVHMPYLEDVLAVVPKDACAQCEIKLYGADYADKFDAAVRAAGLSERNIAVSSFKLEWIADFKRRYPGYLTLWLGAGVNAAEGPWDVTAAIAAAKAARVDVLCPGCKPAMKHGVTAADADRVRTAGLGFRLYGVNSQEQLAYAVKLGAAGFTTDHWREAFDWAKQVEDLELRRDYPALHML